MIDVRKAKLIGAVLGVCLFCCLIAGFTYAYFIARVEKTVTTGSGKFSIDYQIVQNITNTELAPSSNKSEGLHGIVKAKLSENSVAGKFNIYVTPSVITGLASNALKYEVYANGGSTSISSGNFSSATANSPLTVLSSYSLTSTSSYTTFDIYIWLDSSLVTNEMFGKTFTATISADSTAITGEF